MKLIEIVDDVAYIQYLHSHLAPLKKPFYDTIDWLQLAKQKTELLRITEGERGSLDVHPLDGLISLIDAIQDDAEAKNYPVVWAYPRDMWESGELQEAENNE